MIFMNTGTVSLNFYRSHLNEMSRFAASRDPTATASSANLVHRKVSVNNTFRLDVNKTLDLSTKLREEARTFVAVNRVAGGEVPTCSGSVNVGKGSGSALLAAVNQMGEFSAEAPAKPIPLSKSVQREVSKSLATNVGDGDRVCASVVERRSGKPLEEAWDSHVEGLASSNREDILRARKADYEERRKWLREMLNQAKPPPSMRGHGQGRELYTPKNVASQHAIALGTPSDRRAEYDARRRFLKSNLTQDERVQLARQRGAPIFRPN